MATPQRTRLAPRPHRELGEISLHCSYATKLRLGQLAVEIRPARRDAATEAFLFDGLRDHEYCAALLSSWLFRDRQRSEELIADLNGYAPTVVTDVYKRRAD
jgi:hypothetical protein